MPETEYIIKAISYSKPRILLDAMGEAVPARYVVIYAVGVLTDLAGSSHRKVDEIIYNQERDDFEVRFTTVSKQFPKKAMIVVPRLEDTEVLYQEK
jgi:hypothetical protein